MEHIERELIRVRKRLEGARLYAGFTLSSKAMDTVSRLERAMWRLEGAMKRAERRGA